MRSSVRVYSKPWPATSMLLSRSISSTRFCFMSMSGTGLRQKPTSAAWICHCFKLTSDDTPVSRSGTDMKATPASTATPTTTFDICVNAPIASAQRAALFSTGADGKSAVRRCSPPALAA